MSAQHTPGPWEVRFSERGGYDCMTDSFDVVRLQGRVALPLAVLDLSHYGQSWGAEAPEDEKATAKANAHLIAAAPDLLAALKNWQNFDLSLEARQNAAIAAIAKAEGR